VLFYTVGGLREQVEDGVNGFHADCYDVEDLSAKMFKLTSFGVKTSVSWC